LIEESKKQLQNLGFDYSFDNFAGDKKVAPVKQLVLPEDLRSLQDEEAKKQDPNVFDFRVMAQQSQISQSTSHPPMSMGQNIVSPATSQTASNAHNQMPNLSIPPPSLANQSGPPSLVNQNSQPFSRNNSIDQVNRMLCWDYRKF
jgi:hypothetical protein